MSGNKTPGGNNNVVLDSSSNNLGITKNGNATQGAYSPFSIPEGYWSASFDGASDCLEVPASSYFDFGTNTDFTIEAWIKITGVSPTDAAGDRSAAIVTIGSVNRGDLEFNISGNATNTGTYLSIWAGQSSQSFGAPYAFVKDVWYHVACTRSGSTARLFVNGNQIVQAAFAYQLGISTGTVSIGGRNYGANWYHWLNGSISNLRIVKGTALYTANFTPPSTPLAQVSGTALIACQSNRFKDTSTNNLTVSIVGDTKITTDTPFDNPNEITTTIGSAYFDGSGDYFSTPTTPVFGFGTGDFTLEAWVFRSISGVLTTVFEFRTVAAVEAFNMFIGTANKLQFYNGAGGSVVYTSSGSVNSNTWTHVAISRQSDTLRMFINGKLDTTVNGVNTNLGSSWPIRVGSNAAVGYDWQGFISNARVSKGIARYTADFTPGIVTNDANTSLLLNFNNAQVVDSTGRNVLETVGDVKISAVQLATGSGSMYFNGTTDLVKTASGQGFNFGSGDFTIEAWFNASSFGTYGSKRGSIIAHGHWPWVLATYVDSTGKNILQFFGSSDGTSSNIQSGVGQDNAQCSTVGTSLTANAWHHVAVTRSGNTIFCFVDGVLNSSWTSSLSLFAAPATAVAVGGTSNNNASNMFAGYIDDVRITKGFARYTVNFIPQMSELPAKKLADSASDPYWNNVDLLLHMDGTNGSTSIIDEKGSSINVVSAITLDTATKKFGTASAKMNGGSALINSSIMGYGTGDFTLECWIYPTANPSAVGQFFVVSAGGGNSAVVFGYQNLTSWGIAPAGGTWKITSTTLPPVNQWSHLAITRQSGVLRQFLNGVLLSTVTGDATNFVASTSYIGHPTFANSILGYIDEVRSTKGVARYTTNFNVAEIASPNQ